MKVNYITKIETEDIENIDYYISCSGFESRSSYFFSKNKSILQSSKKICFQFNDRKIHARNDNDILYKSAGFTFKTIKSEYIEDCLVILNEIFAKDDKKKVDILIDFSSMTTLIYASLLKYFFSYNDNFIEVNLFFSYTRALYTEPLMSESLLINQPISIFDTIQTTEKKIALIIGLGYERDKAIGLYEYFQNNKEDIYLFIAKNSSDDKFYNTAYENNKDLINIVNDDNLIYYELENIQHLVSSLNSLITFLIASGKRVIIAPTGPKQFTLISLLINLIHKEVTTYRLSYGSKSEAVDRKPDEDKPAIITHINFKAESA